MGTGFNAHPLESMCLTKVYSVLASSCLSGPSNTMSLRLWTSVMICRMSGWPKIPSAYFIKAGELIQPLDACCCPSGNVNCF